MSSLPIVELYFGWPGIGFTLLGAIARQDDELAILGLRRQAVTEHVDLATGEIRSAAENRALEDLATAYYQTAYRLFEQHEFQ